MLPGLDNLYRQTIDEAFEAMKRVAEATNDNKLRELCATYLVCRDKLRREDELRERVAHFTDLRVIYTHKWFKPKVD